MNGLSEEMDLLLIKTVKEHPVIYDTDHPKYADTLVRELSWKKVAAVVNKPSKICKRRWANIRDALRRKIMHDRRRGIKNKRKYKYEDHLEFLKIKEVVHNFADEGESEDYNATADCQLLKVKKASDSEDSVEADTALEFQNVSRDCVADDASIQVYASISHFLNTIGSTLRQLSPYYLNQAKTKIFQIAQEYELAQIVEKEGRPSTSL